MAMGRRMRLALLLALPFLIAPAAADEDARRLRVVTTNHFPPLIFSDEAGNLKGMLVERWAMWEKRTGIPVELQALDWAEAVERMRKGEADVIDAITVTPERQDRYTFSKPYMTLDVTLFHDPDLTGIVDASTARGFVVGVREADACADHLRAAGHHDLRTFTNYAEMMKAAAAHEIRVFCGHRTLVNYYLARAGIAERFISTRALYSPTGHWAVRRDDEATFTLVDQGFEQITVAEHQALLDAWLGMPVPSVQASFVIRHLYTLGASLGGLLLLLLAWIWSTRRAVTRRTAELRSANAKLNERVKEQDCLYAVFTRTEDMTGPLPQLFEELVRLLPQAWLHPEDAIAVIEWEGHTYATGPLEAAYACMSTDICPQGECLGRLSVGYRSPQPAQDEGPFLAEERKLLDAVAERIAGAILRRDAERELAEYREQLERRVVERTNELASLTDRLRGTNAELQAILDSASAGIILVRDARIARCNRSLERLTGCASGELDGTPLGDLFADADAWNGLLAELDQKLPGGETVTRELPAKRWDGKTFWVRLSSRALPDDKASGAFVALMDDITAERAAMAEMQCARELAEEAVRAKADFLANMSHEIRTPLNAIVGLTHLALKAEPGPPIRSYLEKTQASSQHLLALINDILDFSRLEAQKVAIEQVPFSLETLLDDVANLVGEKAASRGLEFLIDIGPEVPDALVGDPLRVGQVLINLVNNAIKFTERGFVSVHVRASETSSDQLTLHFSVRDSGIGLTEAQRTRLFTSFQQADTSITRKYGGSGLGLAISKQLVGLMHGDVGVDSVPGEGSTFWFTVHLGIGQQDPARLQITPDLRGLRTLLVDDSHEAREVIGLMLRSLGIKTTIAASGAEALEVLAAEQAAGRRFDFMLLDSKMPEMDGLEVAEAIQSMPGCKSALLLMASSTHDDEALRNRAQRAGVFELLTKPLTASALFDAVMRHCGHAKVPARRTRSTPATLLATAPQLHGVRALLVEDNALNQEVASGFLRALGLEVDVADDGARAIEMVKARDYDVVLMDMQMPVMDGLSACRAMRKLPALADLPILAMTANATTSDRAQCLDAGMNDHIAKPVDPKVLLDKLLYWVARDRAVEPGAPAQASSSPDAPAAAPPCEGPLRGLLENVPGLDVERGLALALDQEDFYLKLLGLFIEGQADTAQALARAIDASEWKEAQHLTHTLKGVTAQLGATTLTDLATELEQELRGERDRERIQPLLAQIEDELPHLLATLSTRLAKPHDAVCGPPQDHAEWIAMRDELIALLRRDDLDSRKLFEDKRDAFRAALGAHFEAVAAAIERFDFTAALDAIQRA